MSHSLRQHRDGLCTFRPLVPELWENKMNLTYFFHGQHYTTQCCAPSLRPSSFLLFGLGAYLQLHLVAIVKKLGCCSSLTLGFSEHDEFMGPHGMLESALSSANRGGVVCLQHGRLDHLKPSWRSRFWTMKRTRKRRGTARDAKGPRSSQRRLYMVPAPSS